MTQEMDQLPVPLYHSATGAMEAPYLAASGEAARTALPMEGRAVEFAVRSGVRTQIGGVRVVTLQRCAGIGLSMVAWIVLLLGMAKLVLAAMHNRDGELGLGLDATMAGAGACAVSAVLAAIGVPVWVAAERKLRKERRRQVLSGR